MQVLDSVDPGSLERRESHLGVLALTATAAICVGLALIVYPVVFAHPAIRNGPLAKQEFFGGLSILLIGSLADRQIVIRQLRKRLEFEGRTLRTLRHRASRDMLAALPDLNCFRDCLAMECLRASVAKQSFSVLTVKVVPDAASEAKVDAPIAYRAALKDISRKFRGDNSIYNLESGIFGIVLPGVGPLATISIANRLMESLHGASGADGRFRSIVCYTTYPDEVKTAREVEQKLLGLSQAKSVKDAKNLQEPAVTPEWRQKCQTAC